jgi:regulator of sirC expression with transglutaminase-like and TPR domain
MEIQQNFAAEAPSSTVWYKKLEEIRNSEELERISASVRSAFMQKISTNLVCKDVRTGIGKLFCCCVFYY